MTDASGEPPSDEAAPTGIAGVLSRVCFVIGAAGLMIAMAADAIAVAGRHLQLPLVGSIEIVTSCIVVAASAAMVGATMARSHAAVHILTERVSPVLRGFLERLANLFGAVLALALLAGSLWIVGDLWQGAERTEILRLPLKPLRLFWCASVGLMALLFLIRVFAPSPKSGLPDVE